MDDKHIQRMRDRIRKKIEEGITKEEALLSLQRAGIFDQNGNYTEYYPYLRRYQENLRNSK